MCNKELKNLNNMFIFKDNLKSLNLFHAINNIFSILVYDVHNKENVHRHPLIKKRNKSKAQVVSRRSSGH